MYSWACAAVNAAKKESGRIFRTALIATAAASQDTPARPHYSCDAVLAGLFTPIRPQLGRYEVCMSAEPLTALAHPGWKIDAVDPLDAFGAAGSFDRAAVARLFGGRRAAVARGWRRQGGRFEAVTLISPHPNRELTKLEAGTLVIRYFVSE